MFDDFLFFNFFFCGEVIFRGVDATKPIKANDTKSLLRVEKLGKRFNLKREKKKK